MNSNYLFVYGTLLKDFDSYMSKFLEKNSEFIDKGFIHGKLFEISWYPGAVISLKEKDKVYGHIFKILNAEKTFQILDDYEGISTLNELPNEYIRKLIDVYSDSGETKKTWVYLYNLSTENLKSIPSGKYVPF